MLLLSGSHRPLLTTAHRQKTYHVELSLRRAPILHARSDEKVGQQLDNAAPTQRSHIHRTLALRLSRILHAQAA